MRSFSIISSMFFCTVAVPAVMAGFVPVADGKPIVPAAYALGIAGVLVANGICYGLAGISYAIAEYTSSRKVPPQ